MEGSRDEFPAALMSPVLLAGAGGAVSLGRDAWCQGGAYREGTCPGPQGCAAPLVPKEGEEERLRLLCHAVVLFLAPGSHSDRSLGLVHSSGTMWGSWGGHQVPPWITARDPSLPSHPRLGSSSFSWFSPTCTPPARCLCLPHPIPHLVLSAPALSLGGAGGNSARSAQGWSSPWARQGPDSRPWHGAGAWGRFAGWGQCSEALEGHTGHQEGGSGISRVWLTPPLPGQPL